KLSWARKITALAMAVMALAVAYYVTSFVLGLMKEPVADGLIFWPVCLVAFLVPYMVLGTLTRTRLNLDSHELVYGPVGRRRRVPFDGIAAVQLLRVPAPTSAPGNGKDTYEVNLVLKNPPGVRVHISVVKEADRAKNTAQSVSALLKAPVYE